MQNFIYFYQHLPERLSPTVFSVGLFSLSWYSISYLAGFLTVYLLLKYRIKKQENFCNQKMILNSEKLLALLFYIFFGLIIGARLGYVIFYNPVYYFHNLLEIISPFDSFGNLVGIYGMSYHGGLIGAILAGWIFVKKNRLDFWLLADFISPAVPAGYFFGRIGNLMNGELYGRTTEKIWGMNFPADNLKTLRHPTQLYEALMEGLVIFLILWPQRNNPKLKHKLFGLYLSFYAIARFIVEFFRQPDEQLGIFLNFFTLGQILSLFMLLAGMILIFVVPRQEKCYNGK
jgi:phosphatidylglycerol:prolipoprotein diacylglycerol transferase